MTIADPRFAVLLNPNARRVSSSMLNRISDLVDPDHLYVSDDPNKAEDLAKRILDRGYRTVFTGGGDGTVTRFINQMPGEAPAASSGAPRIGILRLGTGNAMAEIVSSGDPLTDLRTYVSNPSSDSYELPLCEAEGVRFAFAGLGLDGYILNDFETLRRKLGRTVFKPMLQNVSGYLAATFGITVPRMVGRWVRRQKVMVRATNVGDTAYAIATDKDGGRVERTVRRGEVLYEGPINAAMFGTCPFYGYRLKALPYAGVDPSRFHLRLCNVPSSRLILQMRQLWKGTLRHPGFVDFNVDKVHLELSEPMPYQLAGEAMGYRDQLTVGLSGNSVDLVRFI